MAVNPINPARASRLQVPSVGIAFVLDGGGGGPTPGGSTVICTSAGFDSPLMSVVSYVNESGPE
jgi:hypothetical protein